VGTGRRKLEESEAFDRLAGMLKKKIQSKSIDAVEIVRTIRGEK